MRASQHCFAWNYHTYMMFNVQMMNWVWGDNEGHVQGGVGGYTYSAVGMGNFCVKGPSVQPGFGCVCANLKVDGADNIITALKADLWLCTVSEYIPSHTDHLQQITNYHFTPTLCYFGVNLESACILILPSQVLNPREKHSIALIQVCLTEVTIILNSCLVSPLWITLHTRE